MGQDNIPAHFTSSTERNWSVEGSISGEILMDQLYCSYYQAVKDFTPPISSLQSCLLFRCEGSGQTHTKKDSFYRITHILPDSICDAVITRIPSHIPRKGANSKHSIYLFCVLCYHNRVGFVDGMVEVTYLAS